MNKQQMLNSALRILEERRNAAEEKAEITLERLRANKQWYALETQLRAAQVDLAMGGKDELKDRIAELEKERDELLGKLHLSPNDLVPQYSCKKCNDRGYVDGRQCDCLKRELQRLIIAESDLMNEDYTFGNSAETDRHNVAVYNRAQKLCREGKPNMLISGNVGSGKTYLLTACANLCAALGRSVRFVTAFTLNGDMMTAHLQGNEAREAILNEYIDVEVLLIDDLGSERIYKDVTAPYLFAIINERLVRKKQTFISTNLTLTEIRERYDERIFSRLVDRSSIFVAQLIGEDKRLNIK